MEGAKHLKFQLQDGIMRYACRVQVGINTLMQQKIISSMHADAIGGHSRFQVTYNRVHKLFALARNEKGDSSFRIVLFDMQTSKDRAC